MDIKYKLIDVSAHNGNIDFAKVKSDGIDGVIIRGGYGVSTVDKCFHQNIQNAIKSGLHVGVYWFGYAYTVSQAEKEANFCLKTIEPYKGKIDLPIFYDWEYDSYNYAKNTGKVTPTKEKISAWVDKFCSIVEKSGYFVGVYGNIDYLTNYFNNTIKTKYTIWVAQWNTKCSYTGNYGIWQYGAETNKIDSKTVNGISGVVDKDYCYIDYPTIIKANGLNGYQKIDTSNYHYDVNNDGSIDNQDLKALQDYLNN
jgi:GH25 family lysozyme M1 (1,4-beta-N-acetylmuramidase)